MSHAPVSGTEGRSGGPAYIALQNANLELLQRLAGLVTVADILKGLGGVLAGNIEKDLLTATAWGKSSD